MTHDPNRSDDSIPNAAATELQQLEAALQAKLISPELFATLAAQLRPAKAPTASPSAPPTSPAPASEPTELPSLLSLFESVPASPPQASPVLPVPAPATPSVVAVPQLPPALSPGPPPQAAGPVAPPPAARPVARLAKPAAPRPDIPTVAAPPVYDTASETEPSIPLPRNFLTTMLVTLGGVGLLGVGFYLYVDRSHPNENPTGSHSVPTEEAAPATLPAPEVAAASKTVRMAAPSAPTSNASTLATPKEVVAEETPAATLDTEEAIDASAPESPPAASAAPIPAAPEPGDDDAAQKIRTVLADYYADLFAPPLTAENYFAPQVERLYIQKNLTPAQINATITQTFFPDNKQAVYQVEPGTLRVSAPVQDGSRTATYSEAVRLFRVSKGRYQRLRTQVRVKFDAGYHITFLRQEKMLENVFE